MGNDGGVLIIYSMQVDQDKTQWVKTRDGGIVLIRVTACVCRACASHPTVHMQGCLGARVATFTEEEEVGKACWPGEVLRGTQFVHPGPGFPAVPHNLQCALHASLRHQCWLGVQNKCK